MRRKKQISCAKFPIILVDTFSVKKKKKNRSVNPCSMCRLQSFPRVHYGAGRGLTIQGRNLTNATSLGD